MKPPADDLRLEQAILALLEREREVYPTDMVALLRAQDANLPFPRLRDVLERLFTERRVARLWHRYLLARDVDAVRRKWLGMITLYGARRDTTIDAGSAHEAHALVASWDGWRLPEGGSGMAP